MLSRNMNQYLTIVKGAIFYETHIPLMPFCLANNFVIIDPPFRVFFGDKNVLLLMIYTERFVKLLNELQSLN